MLIFYFYIFLQIVTESLPVSSSGHMRLAEMGTGILWSESVREYAYQLAPYAPMIMFILHIPTLIICVGAWVTRWRVHSRALFSSWRMFIGTGISGFIATTITMLFFVLQQSPYAVSIPLPIGFFITACALFSTRYCSQRGERTHSTVADGCVLGIMQGCALLPGVSRFAMVLVASLWRGMEPLYALFFTWLLAMPLFAVSGLVGLYRLHHDGLLSHLMSPLFLLVMAGSMIVGWYALRVAERCILTGRVWYFALYLFGVMSILLGVQMFH